ncbi:MAG TPA: M23 family metallopeptidase [Candidatus Acidoferrales bacterium]
MRFAGARNEILRLLVAVFLFALLAGGASAQSGAADTSLAGTWAGVLAGQLHLVVTITKSGDGGYRGTLNSVDQHATLVLSAIALKGNSVRFEVPRVGGIYEGALDKNGGTISGSWTQAGEPTPQPLELKRTGDTAQSPSAPAALPAHTPKPVGVGFNAVASITPQAFKADGKWHLVYELHVSNLDKWDCRFTRIDVLDGGAPQKTLASFSGSGLDKMFKRPGLPNAEKISNLTPGEFGIVFLWVDFDRLEDVPATLAHRITVKVGDYPEELTAVTPAIAVDRNPVVAIASPLTGDEWVAGNGPSNASAHRTTVIPINGHAYAAQRFAIDWVEIYPDGKTYRGDPFDNKNYRAYGAEVHAVADGTVTQTLDGLPQNIPNSLKLAVELTLENIGGNHVIVDIGDGLYAFYAHMQTGSVRVKVGDKVVRGQVLGLLGNSGNSSEPHLHFHICDRSSELGCEGLPYALKSFDLLGKGDKWESTAPHTAVPQELQIPTEDEVVSFPPAAK